MWYYYADIVLSNTHATMYKCVWCYYADMILSNTHDTMYQYVWYYYADKDYQTHMIICINVCDIITQT